MRKWKQTYKLACLHFSPVAGVEINSGKQEFIVAHNSKLILKQGNQGSGNLKWLFTLHAQSRAERHKYSIAFPIHRDLVPPSLGLTSPSIKCSEDILLHTCPQANLI